MVTPNETTSADAIRENLVAAEPPRRPGMAKYSVYYFRHKLLGTVGLAIVVVMVLTAIFADLIAPYTYQEQNYEAVLHAPGIEFFFGTDNFGRDVFSRVVHGARISMLVGFLSVTVGTGIGAVVGLASGFFMGKVDALVQRIVDMWMSFPDLILALTIVAVFGNTMPNVILAIAATILPRGVRIIRSATIAIREMDYTMAARSIGASDIRTMLRHVYAEYGGSFPDNYVLNVRHRYFDRGRSELSGLGHFRAYSVLGTDAHRPGRSVCPGCSLDPDFPGPLYHRNRYGICVLRGRFAGPVRPQAARPVSVTSRWQGHRLAHSLN